MHSLRGGQVRLCARIPYTLAGWWHGGDCGGGGGDIIGDDDDDVIDGDNSDDGTDVDSPRIKVMGEYETPKTRRLSAPLKRPPGLYPLDVVTLLHSAEKRI